MIEAVLTCPPESISEHSLRQTVKQLHRQAKATKFKYHDGPTLISIRLFTSDNRHNDQFIASCTQLGSEPFSVIFNQGELADLRTPPEVKFGLTEDQRKSIYWELWLAEMRASSEVNRSIPEYGAYTLQHAAREDELNQQFEKVIQERHGLTSQQIDSIGAEGLQYSWAHPD